MAFENNETEEEKKLREEKARAKIAAEVTADFERRREERRSIESGWLLNMNFLSGNQYCDVSPQGGIAEEDKRFYWQSRRVFNHIAPTIDTRIAKLTKMRPALHVRAFSDEEGDVKAAKLASGVLDYVGRRIGLDEVVANATLWSETCGSAFYKVVWDERGGRQVAVDAQGLPVYEGEADVAAVSPFEIFPDSLGAESLAEVKSLIHARVVPVEYIAEKFGVVLKGREIIGPVAAGYSEPSGAKNPALQAGGSCLPTENGEILSMRQITSICLRVARRHTGCADPLLGRLLQGGGIAGALICGEPSSGKTSLLRDMARQLSDGSRGRRYHVAVVDERGELGADRGLPECDVLLYCPKEKGIEQAVRCLAPDVVLFDELGTPEETRAVTASLNAGTAVISTAHCRDLATLRRRPHIVEALRSGAFDYLVFLSGRDTPGRIDRIVRTEEMADEDCGTGAHHPGGDLAGAVGGLRA